MNDNVIILGAGFSHNANIPLLNNFIERMWEYSIRGRAGSKQLNENEKDVLEEALKIRLEMDGYHGRVAFDDRNIEDILSMLVFNLLGGGTSEKNKLKAFINAISTTIELACNVTHPGIPNGPNPQYEAVTEGANVYRKLWKALFSWHSKGNSIPTIITFNYDLVLERSLLQLLINKFYNRQRSVAPFNNLSVNYRYKYFPQQYYRVKYANYGHERTPGTILELSDDSVENDCTNIELLKLHGSLNFPTNKPSPEMVPLSIVNAIDNPYILPPVSNKQSNSQGDQSWKVALQRLREAKNVIFLGYSLPKTDMYMQFFLKAALGPNHELNKLIVFDPILWGDTNLNTEMRNRYESCFAEQLRSRIDFNPGASSQLSDSNAGTTAHFVSVLENNPEDILF